MATIEYYREREAASAAEAADATTERERAFSRRAAGVWRKLAEIAEKREALKLAHEAASPTANARKKKAAAGL